MFYPLQWLQIALTIQCNLPMPIFDYAMLISLTSAKVTLLFSFLTKHNHPTSFCLTLFCPRTFAFKFPQPGVFYILLQVSSYLSLSSFVAFWWYPSKCKISAHRSTKNNLRNPFWRNIQIISSNIYKRMFIAAFLCVKCVKNLNVLQERNVLMVVHMLP